MNQREVEIISEFSEIKSDLEKWGSIVDSALHDVLKPLFDEYKVKINPSFRLKDEKSYLSKALWRDKIYDNPILKIEDKIGTRVVFLYSTNVKEASGLILHSDKWNSKITKEYDEISKVDPDKFGYQSMHIVVWPNDQDEFNCDTNVLTCEVQLRTLLQHAYSEISHDSTYKGPFKNDKEIARKLSKSMALMEATDDYFCSIFEMIVDDSRKVRNFTNELINLFKEINPSFQKEEIDKELTEIFFNFLDEQEITIQVIKEVYLKNKQIIEHVIKEPVNYLTTQPVFLLVVTLFYKYRYQLVDKWPVKSNLLDELFLMLGVSRE